MFFSLSQMPQKMPWFSKDTMRATLCTLVFLFSLPRSLNGHLTTSNKNIEVPNTPDLRQKDSTIDSGRDDVVLLSKSVQKFQLTSHSEQRGIRPNMLYDDEISYQRMSRKIQNDEHNLTTSTSQPERQIIQEVVATSEKEHQISVLIPLQKEVAQKSTKRLTNTGISSKEKTNRKLLDKLEATHVSVSRSIKTKHVTSHSEQGSILSQMLNSKGKISSNTTKRNTFNVGQNLTFTLAKPKSKIIPREATTLQKEQQKPSRRPHTASPLRIENATELNASNETPNTTRADVLPEEKTSIVKAIHVSVSRYMQKQQFAIHSAQRGIHPRMLNSKDETSKMRKKREAGDGEHNLTTTLAQSQKAIMQKEETTPQKEQRNPTKSFHRREITHLWMENATELNGSIKTPNATMVDTVFPKERTSRGPSEMQAVITVSLTSSNDDKTTDHRARKTVDESKLNFTTFRQPEKQIKEDEVTTPQNEQLRPTESATRLQRTSLYILTQPPTAIRADDLQMKTTSWGHSETQKATQETSAFTVTHEVLTNETGMGINNTSTYGVVPTNQPSKETTDHQSLMTHSHSSTIIASTKFNGDLDTSGVKTTEKEVTEKSTKSPKPETPFMTTSTTKKTTPKQTSSPPTGKEKQQGNPGPVVAAVIITTFILMFITIIVISVRKRKMQQRQLENPEWAGPSPFLDGEVQPNLPNMDESGAINRQAFNQNSLSKYLPNRLSKHLPSRRSTHDEVFMGDILQGSTFGRQIPDESQAPNGNWTAAQNPTETEENTIQASVDSSDTKTHLPGNAQETGTDSEQSKHTDDLTPSSGTDTTIKPPPLVSIDLDSLSEEAGTLQTSDVGTVPPAPPLP